MKMMCLHTYVLMVLIVCLLSIRRSEKLLKEIIDDYANLTDKTIELYKKILGE